MSLCPRCGLAPPRYPAGRYQGRIPLCLGCMREKWKLKWQRRRARVNDDISPAEIDRRFAVALQQIRRRAWTSDHSS